MGVAFVYTAALSVTIGAFITGYGIGSVNGLQNFVGFLETFGLLGNTSTVNSSDSSECIQPSELPAESLLILGAMVASITIGGSLATLTSGKPVDLFGRKIMLIVSGILTVVGGAIQTASFYSWMFIIGRLICGFAYGIVYTAAPVYIAEISPLKVRGRVTALIGPTITLGILSGYVVSFLLNGEVFGWRVSRALICVMGAVYIVALAFLPRSPRWLVLRKKETEAARVLRKTLPLDDHNSILLEIATIRKSLSSEKTSFKHEMMLVFNWRTIKRIILGGLLHGLGSLSGNYVFYFSEILFCSFGIMPFVTLIVVGVCSFGGTIFIPSIVDKVGRKCLLLTGGLIMATLNGLSATLILSFNLEEENNEVVGYVVVGLVCIFTVVFSATWYILPIVVTSETFPPEVRAVGNGVSSLCYWVVASVISQLFPYIFSLLRSYGTLYLIGCINIVAVLYCLVFLPETKGVSLEDMDKLFTKSCFIGLSRCRCCVSDGPGAHVQSPNQVDPEIPSVSSTVPLTDLVTEYKTTKRNDNGFLCTSV